MSTTTERPSASDLREARAKREAAEARKAQADRDQAAMAEAREEAAAASQTNGGSRGGARADAQQGMFDREIENTDLVAALEDREKVKASRAALNAKFKEADDKAKALISELDIQIDETVRVGRFRISKSEIAGRSVAFDTEASERLSISLLDD